MSAEREPLGSEPLRIDKWLWFTRFFRTRTLAAKAVSGGHVRVNGVRVKASRDVVAGDVLSIQRGTDRIECTVVSVPQRRGSAREAQQCYQETGESLAARQAHAAQRRAFAAVYAQPTAGKPDKRTRRMLRSRFRETQDS
jgi:ribosome-associated heat shock protein Hsp15